MADQEESSQRAPPMSPPPPPPPSPAIPEEEESNQRAPPMSPPSPPPPSPAILEDSSSEAILSAASDDCSSNTPHTDLLSLCLSNYTALPQPKAEEEPLVDVPTLLNFELESSFPDLEDWNTTGTTVTQAPVVTQSLWVQLHTPTTGEVDDLSGLALGIRSPIPSISPLALGILSPQASISPLALGIQAPQASSRIETPQASLSPLALGIQSPQTSFEFGIQSAPASYSSLPSIPSTLPIAPPLGNSLPSPSPVPERRSWCMFLSAPPPAWRHPLLPHRVPHSASSSVSAPSSHPSHQTHHFFPAANTGYQQQVPVAHAPVTFSTPNANADANSLAGFVPASRPSWLQAMASRGSWIPNQPWINNGQHMKLPIPRRPQFLVPPVAATVPEPLPLLANFGSSVGNTPNCNAIGDVPDEGHQEVQTGESSRPSRKRSRKRSKLAVRIEKQLFK